MPPAPPGASVLAVNAFNSTMLELKSNIMIMGLKRKMGLLGNKYAVTEELRRVNRILKAKEKDL